MPTLVEVSYSETRHQLELDMEFWLVQSNGESPWGNEAFKKEHHLPYPSKKWRSFQTRRQPAQRLAAALHSVFNVSEDRSTDRKLEGGKRGGI